MNTDDIDKLSTIFAKATQPPVADMTSIMRAAYKAYKKRTGKWWHGNERTCMPLVFVAQPRHQGDAVTADDIPINADRWDLDGGAVVSVWWSELKGKEVFNTGVQPNNLEALVALWNAAPELFRLARIGASLDAAEGKR